MSNTHKTRRAARAKIGALGVCVGLLLFLFTITSSFDVRIGQASASVPSYQETPSPTPSPTPDEVLEQAKREAQIADELKKKAVADKERIEAENAKLKAEVQPLGAATVNVPTGSVTTDAAGWVESEMLAQEAAKEITAHLRYSLCHQRIRQNSASINKLVVYNNSDLAGVELYNTVIGQLDKLIDEFTDENNRAEKLLLTTEPTATPTPTPPSGPTPTPGVSVSVVGALAAPGIATGVIKSVAELINLFRTDTSFANKTVQVTEDRVVSHLVYLLDSGGGNCSNNLEVYYPALFPPGLTTSSDTSVVIGNLTKVERIKNQAANLVERIDKRIEQLTKLAATIEDLNRKRKARGDKAETLAAKKEELKKCKKRSVCKQLKAQIAELEKAISDLDEAIKQIEDGLTQAFDGKVAIVKQNAKENFKKWLEDLATEKVQLQSLINSTNLLTSKLNTPDESTKLSAMAQLLRAEKLNNILSDDHTFTLRVAVTANGTTKIKKNMFVDAKVRHSAGANLVYQLFNQNGAVVQSNVLQCYIDYRSAQEVRDIVASPYAVECKPSGKSRTNTAAND